MSNWKASHIIKEAVTADADRKVKASKELVEAWNTLAEFIHGRGGWVVSVPARKVLRFQVREGAELPIRLAEKGFRLHYVARETRLDIEGDIPVDEIEISLDGR